MEAERPYVASVYSMTEFHDGTVFKSIGYRSPNSSSNPPFNTETDRINAYSVLASIIVSDALGSGSRAVCFENVFSIYDHDHLYPVFKRPLKEDEMDGLVAAINREFSLRKVDK